MDHGRSLCKGAATQQLCVCTWRSSEMGEQAEQQQKAQVGTYNQKD